MTEDINQIIFPKGVSYEFGMYRLPGYHCMSNYLAFIDLTTPMYGRKGQELRIWYREDLIGYTEENNGGVTCADVYAKYY